MRKILKFILFVFVAVACPILIYYQEQKIEDLETIPSVITKQSNIESNLISDIDSYTFDNPKVVLNPYGNSPLTALIIFNTKDITTPTVKIKGKDELTTLEHTFPQDNMHILPVYGLYPDTNNEIILSIKGKEKSIFIKTDALPDDFILPTHVSSNKNKLDNDLYFFTPSTKGYTCAYDINGDVRWYLNDNYIWDIQNLENGHLLLSSNRLVGTPYYMNGLVEMDYLGKIYYEYQLPDGYHHDVVEMPNNNLLVSSNILSRDTREDYIIELDRQTGDIVSSYDLKKLLPKEITNEYNWFKNNSISFDKNTNSITISGANANLIVNIDYNTGNLNWLIGNSTDWPIEYKKYFLNKTDDFSWPINQSSVNLLQNNEVLLFDNRDGENSRCLKLKIDENNVSKNWEYNIDKNSQISNIEYLDTNHYLIGYNENTNITKELLNDEVIFEMELPTNNYRVKKLNFYYNYNYALGPGNVVGSMGITEENNERRKLVLFSKNSSKIMDEYEISFTKEEDRLVFNAKMKKDDKITIILSRMSSQKSYDVKPDNFVYDKLDISLFDNKDQDYYHVTKYINDLGLNSRYEIYLKINGKIYKTNKAVTF